MNCVSHIKTGLILFCFIAVPFFAQGQWTWVYSKRFQPQELTEKKNIVFSQTDTPLFSQLILSWNSFRPYGYFTIFAQARNSATKEWYDAHHMIDWGADVQKSYCSISPRGTGCYHVRLEVNNHAKADGFRIKIEAHDGADLELLKALFVSVSDLQLFASPRYSMIMNQVASLPSVKIEGVPQLSQMILDHPRANNLCSPTSMSMLIGFFKQTFIDPLSVAQKVYDAGLESYGSWPFNAAHAFEACQGQINFCVTRLFSFEKLHKQLMRNIPVMVSVRGDLKGAMKPFEHGHLLLVTGWDSKHKKVICHDPASPTNEEAMRRYDISDFLVAWGRSHNLAYIAESTVLA
jgi:hypothetical protein